MKRLLALLGAVLCLCVANAQDSQQNEEEGGEETNVVAYFCKRDTMQYSFQSVKYKANETDTIIKSVYHIDFTLSVADSTSNGYRLEYVMTNFEREDTIRTDAQALMHQRVFDRLKGKKLVFLTDEVGNLLQLENWSAVRNDMIQGVYAAYNELYPLMPGLEELLPKGQLMGVVSNRFQTEEGIRDWFQEVTMLFQFHGRSYEEETLFDEAGDEEEPPSRTVVVSGLCDEEDALLEGDYYVSAQTTTELEGENVERYINAIVGELGEDNELGKLMIEQSKKNGSKMTIDDTYSTQFFYNGWPSSVVNLFEMTEGSHTESTLKSVEWVSRSWGNF